MLGRKGQKQQPRWWEAMHPLEVQVRIVEGQLMAPEYVIIDLDGSYVLPRRAAAIVIVEGAWESAEEWYDGIQDARIALRDIDPALRLGTISIRTDNDGVISARALVRHGAFDQGAIYYVGQPLAVHREVSTP